MVSPKKKENTFIYFFLILVCIGIMIYYGKEIVTLGQMYFGGTSQTGTLISYQESGTYKHRTRATTIQFFSGQELISKNTLYDTAMKPLYPIGSPVIILQWKNNIFLKDLFSSEISRFLFYFLISLFFFIVALKIFLNKQFHKKTYTKESQVAEWEQKIDSLPNTQDNKKVSLLLIWIPIGIILLLAIGILALFLFL